MNINHAFRIGSDTLIWLAEHPEEMSHFSGATGISLSDIRERAEDPEFIGFVLEFLLGSDETVLAISTDIGVDPLALGQARSVLPGGDEPNWT